MASRADHASLLREMRRALLAEFGARSIYRRLAKLVRDAELARLLANFALEEDEQIDRLRASMIELGAKPRSRSLRRTVLANLLAFTAPVIGQRLALRICEDAEERRARWYAHFNEYLLHHGELELAKQCAHMSLTKQRHAQALQAWVDHG